jgi:hypothetical protein
MTDGKEVNPFHISVMELPTLRDQIAMAALTGLLAHEQNQCDYDRDVVAAYKYADVMLAEKEKRNAIKKV